MVRYISHKVVFVLNDHLEVCTSFFLTVLIRKWISLVFKLISQMSFQNPVVVLRKSLHLFEHASMQFLRPSDGLLSCFELLPVLRLSLK